MTKAPEPLPASQVRPLRPGQPATAIISRLLLSAVLIGAAGAGFRLSLVPATTAAQPLTRTVAQAEATQGAPRARLTLSSDWVDLNLAAAALPGQVMRGQATLPVGAAISRVVRRDGDLLATSYTERWAATNLTGPLRLRLDQHGLNLLDAPSGAGRVGLWSVKLARGLPVDLRLHLASGDANLVLTTATLTGLTVRSASGNQDISLPLQMNGDARFQSTSGDIQLSQTGSIAPGRPARALEAQTESGNLNLNLAGAAFGRVRAISRSGDQSVTLPARPSVAATLATQSGNLNLTVPAGLTRGDLNLTSASGDLGLRLPAGAAVRLNVSTGSGDVSVPDSYTRRNSSYLSPAALEGGPALNLNVTTGSGNVAVTEDSR